MAGAGGRSTPLPRAGCTSKQPEPPPLPPLAPVPVATMPPLLRPAPPPMPTPVAARRHCSVLAVRAGLPWGMPMTRVGCSQGVCGGGCCHPVAYTPGCTPSISCTSRRVTCTRNALYTSRSAASRGMTPPGPWAWPLHRALSSSAWRLLRLSKWGVSLTGLGAPGPGSTMSTHFGEGISTGRGTGGAEGRTGLTGPGD